MDNSRNVLLEGSFVALVTPFTSDGSIDYDRIAELVEFHISSGTDGIVPCGCTGEAATLNHDEQKSIMSFVVEKAAGRVLVVPGTGSNSTREAISLTAHAKSAGADAVLLISPYYNKPTQAGLVAHYKAIAAAVDIPLMLYNVPSRTGGPGIMPETVAELAQVPNVVAIKEAGGSVDRVSAIRSLCDITVLSGDDSLTIPMMAVGARGVVSVAANVVPAQLAQMVRAHLDGDVALAEQRHYELLDMFKALFVETNPIPAKYALNIMGKIDNVLRLPLLPLSENCCDTVRTALEGCGVELSS